MRSAMTGMLTPEIWHTAVAMVRHYGPAAAARAATQAAAHLAQGDMRHTLAWQKVAEAIILLQSECRRGDETIH